MAWFTVQYRGPDGKNESVQIEAADRAGVFAELKKRGISAVRVEEAKGKVKPTKSAVDKTGKSQAIAKGLVAGVIVVASAIAAWYFLSQKPEAPTEPTAEKPTKTPLAVSKKVISKSVDEKVEEPPKVDPNARPAKVGEVVNGYVKLPTGRMHRIRGEITNDVAGTSTPLWYQTFEFQSENELATLLTIPPGTALVGSPHYLGRFKQNFIKSLEKPILIFPDDSDELKELKRTMIETKKELKAALDAGEDIEQIMTDTHTEIQELGLYKQMLESEVRELVKSEDAEVDDIDSYIEAANKMLAARGVAPLELGPVARKRLERMILQRKENK